MNWSTNTSTPIVTLICPPEEIYAPLRVVFQLSWKDKDEIPDDLENLVPVSGALTRVRFSSQKVSVLLHVAKNAKGYAGRRWVDFTRVVQVGFIPES